MREIKFRGLNRKSGNWHYGYYSADEYSDKFIKNVDMIWEEYTPYYVDRDTVGQYTGLKDKNSKEIYEGDIVRLCDVKRPSGIDSYYHDVDYRIVFKYNMWYMEIIRNFKQACYYSGARINDIPLDFLEVIGNIYENKELLK